MALSDPGAGRRGPRRGSGLVHVLVEPDRPDDRELRCNCSVTLSVGKLVPIVQASVSATYGFHIDPTASKQVAARSGFGLWAADSVSELHGTDLATMLTGFSSNPDLFTESAEDEERFVDIANSAMFISEEIHRIERVEHPRKRRLNGSRDLAPVPHRSRRGGAAAARLALHRSFMAPRQTPRARRGESRDKGMTDISRQSDA